jgi:hypothetical protein
MTEILISSGVSTILLATAGWLARTWIAKRLTEDLRKETEIALLELRAKLDSAQESIRSVTAAATQARAQAQAALLPSKIQAIETIWKSVIEWRTAEGVCLMTSVFPIDWIRKYGNDPKTKSNIETMLAPIDYVKFMLERNEAESARPFITEKAWALYFAYHSLYSTRLMKAQLLTISGIEHGEIWERIKERALIEASASPEILAKYDAEQIFGISSYFQYLTQELLVEFRSDLSGNHSSTEAAINVSKVMATAEELIRSARTNESDKLVELKGLTS